MKGNTPLSVRKTKRNKLSNLSSSFVDLMQLNIQNFYSHSVTKEQKELFR